MVATATIMATTPRFPVSSIAVVSLCRTAAGTAAGSDAMLNLRAGQAAHRRRPGEESAGQGLASQRVRAELLRRRRREQRAPVGASEGELGDVGDGQGDRLHQ